MTDHAHGSVFEMVADHAPDPLMLASHGTIDWISPAIADVLGWSAEELTTRNLAHLCDPQDRDRLVDLWNSTANGHVHRGVFRMRSKDGNTPSVLLTVAPGNGSGDRSIVASLREIDQRLRSEHDLKQAEEQYRLMLEWSSDVIMRVSLESVIEWVTPSVTRMLGWLPEEMVGTESMSYLHPDDARRLRKEGFPVTAPAQVRQALGRWRCKDGSWRWVDGSTQVVPPTGDRPGFRVSRISDVHAEVEARQALAESEGHLRLVMEHAPVGMCQASADSRLLSVNSAMCQFLGRHSGEVVQHALAEFTHPDDIAADALLVKEMAEGSRESFRLTRRYLRPDGSIVWGDLSVACLRNEDRSVRAFISQVIDVTEQHEVQALLRGVFDSSLEPHVLLRAVRAPSGEITDFVYVDANAVACEVMNAQRASLVGSRVRDLYPEQAARQAIALYADILQSGAPLALDAWAYPGQLAGQERRYDIRGTIVDARTLSFAWRDVTERVQAAERLASSEARLRAVMDAAPAGIASVGLDGRFEQVNPSMCQMLGYQREWLTRHGLADVLHPDDALLDEQARAGLDTAEHDRAILEERLVRRDGHTIWVQHSMAAMRNADGTITSYVSHFVEVTDARSARERIRRSERQYRLLAENVSDVVAHLRDGLIAWISPSCTTSLGGSASDWVGRFMRDVVHPFDLPAYGEAMERVAAGEAVVRRMRILAEDGSYHWMEAHLAPFRIETGGVDGASASMRNVDAEVQALAELDRQARFDALTGLLSRREALHRLDQARAPGRLPGGAIAVLFCDIDRFKDINDAYGHAAGDIVLRVLAQRISDAVRLDDVVARMGGDELLVLMGGVHEIEEAIRSAEKLRLLAMEPIAVDGNQVRTSMSIGVTLAAAGEPVDQLVARADTAMYEAKHAGRNRVTAFQGAAPGSAETTSLPES